ncbi:Mu transposase C-terminal domain-containing protein [Rhizobium rhizogenes]|uniref:Mu transposase C-terminal domain-containing protein n=1 Tax=Rhizobium rhizogenes TaxID=359 RepID=UPI001573026B|nr:Mu transposase C-terminal domain-containing protein [Rhizobium rhizogenes]NTF64915.1 transposase [Rhizobium rhizogenes]NTG96263.1 transposase [Rhizobium rhizogenes]
MTIAFNNYRKEQEIKFYRFFDGDRTEYKGLVYCWKETTRDGHFLRRQGDEGPEEFFSHQELSRMFNDKREPMGYLPRRRAMPGSTVSSAEPGTLSLLKPEQQEDIIYKKNWCLRFLQAETRGEVARSIARAAEFITQSQSQLVKEVEARHKASGKTRRTKEAVPDAPNARTLLGWVKSLERAAFDPVVFLDKTGMSNRKDHFTADELEIIEEYVVMYASSDRPYIKDLHEMLADAIAQANAEREAKNAEMGGEILPALRTPNIDTFSARIKKLPRAHIDLGRLSTAAAKAKYDSVYEGIDVIRPLERIEIDESVLDLQTIFILSKVWKTLTPEERKVAERIRLWITAIIDVASKCILGLRIHNSDPSTASAIATLEMATRDKTELANSIGCETSWDYFGNPEEVALDSATWLASREMQVAVNDIGATFFQPRAGDASARGSIERWFRTQNRSSLAFFSGRTWGSIDEKGDIDPRKEASVTFDNAAEFVTRFMVDVYHNTPHYGLNGETPRQAWNRLNKFHKPTPPISQNLRRHIFGVKTQRKISKAGIRFLGIQYNSKELEKLFRLKDEPVNIRVDRHDLGAISVEHVKGWLRVPATHQEFAGMSVWRWMAFNQQLGLFNKQNAEVPKAVALKTKEWLRKQADLARAEAELGSAIVTHEDFQRFERKLPHRVGLVDDAEGAASSFNHEVNLIALLQEMDSGLSPKKADHQVAAETPAAKVDTGTSLIASQFNR